jgi:hypothetical protein
MAHRAPRDLARRFLAAHDLRPPVSYSALVAACTAAGIRVVLTTRPLRSRALAVTGWTWPVIILSPSVHGDAWALSHEIAHLLASDLTDQPPRTFRAAPLTGREAWAEEFARCVAGHGLDDGE